VKTVPIPIPIPSPIHIPTPAPVSLPFVGSESCRFAPTPSGPAHPGTLLAGLLAWLDARRLGARFLLRLEDVDPLRCTPAHARELCEALGWLGLDWDSLELQSESRARHEAALDRLARGGWLHPCACTRAELRSAGLRAADGGFRDLERCAARELPGGSWRAALAAGEALRLRLPRGRIALCDESGLDLSQDPAAEMGNPVLVRRDGAIAYHLAAVVDDAEQGITRVVRGRDLATSTAIQVALQRALGLPTPRYRHHLLLLEEAGGKLAKLHGAVGWRALAARRSGAELCGWLAGVAGIQPGPRPAAPRELLAGFDWARVRAQDLILRWDGEALRALG